MERGLEVNISILPLEDLPAVAEEILATLRKNPNDWLAPRDLNDICIQAPFVLHSHLDELFELGPQMEDGSYVDFAWRESGLQHFEFLKQVVLDESQSMDVRIDAVNKLMETRQTEAFDFVESVCTALDMTFRYWLEGVGYDKQGDIYKPLYTEPAYCIIFPADYRQKMYPKPSSNEHPTWHLPVTNEIPQRFGGTIDAECAICGGKLHHLITLNPIPDSLRISNLSSLTLAVCLSCLGWNPDTSQYLYYEHDADGIPRHIGYAGERIQPEFPTLGIEETTVYLVDGGARWRWSDWGNEYNMHRVGGFPWWIQSPDYPQCIRCQKSMRFLFQLDSSLPSPDSRDEWIWGEYGYGYGLWCDDCQVSSYLWQCT
jgi:hypothetical protein